MSEKRELYIIYAILIFAVALLAYEVGRDIVNPCVEWSDEREIICSGIGDAYECDEIYPCIRRKYD